MNIEYSGIRFSLSTTTVDQTVLAFVDRAAGPTLSVTVAHEKLGGALLQYVADQLAALRKEVPGYTVVNQRELDDKRVLVEAVISAGRDRRGQRQLFVHDDSRGRVIVATVNAQEANDPRASETLEELVRTLATRTP